MEMNVEISTSNLNCPQIRNFLIDTCLPLVNWSILIGLFILILIVPSSTSGCPIELPTTVITIKGHALTVELATTPVQRGCGLSHRETLALNHGMLFIFPDNRPRSFWMKDTFIPLSIAYLDRTGRILSIHNMVPSQTDQKYPSGHPASFALEVNQGWFREKGIEIGDIVEMELPLVLDIR